MCNAVFPSASRTRRTSCRTLSRSSSLTHISSPRLIITILRNTRFVLRKKPAGKLLSKTAHRIEREYAVLRALHLHNEKASTRPEARVPVPEPIVLCMDESVIGTPFYIMEFLDGRIFTDIRMLEISPQDRREWCVCMLKAVCARPRIAVHICRRTLTLFFSLLFSP